MSGQVGNLTNLETSASTGTVRLLVPFSEGDMPDLATLRASRAIQVGATTYPTHWRKRGQDHPDGSLQFAYAEWRMTLDAGVGSPTAPTHLPEVVIADNTGTAAADFEDWADELSIVVAYDADEPSPHGTTSVSEDIAALARAGTNGATRTVTDEGGTRFIHYSAHIGPGRRRSPTPSSSPSTWNGLLHVQAFVQIRDQDDHAEVALIFSNDVAYPYPAGPPNPSLQDPSRPTRLIAAQGEEHERPPVRYIDGLSVTVGHSTETLWSRPWYVNNHTTGAGPFGTITTSGNTTQLPIEGLGWIQGWGARFTVSTVDQAHAEATAARPFTYLATPTYQTWLDCERTVTLSGGLVDGDTITINGWGEFQIPDDIPASKLSTWYQRGPSLGFLSTTESNHWKRLGKFSNPDPGGTGKHYSLGFLYEAEAVFGGSVWHLYRHGAESLREYTARPELYEQEALEATDLLEDSSGNLNNSCVFQGGKLFTTSRVVFARAEATSNNFPWDSAHWNGSPASFDNPEAAGSLSQWTEQDHEHQGAGPLLHYALLTDCPAARWLLRSKANTAARTIQCRGYTSFNNGVGLQPRGEGRSLGTAWQGWIMQDDATWSSAIQSHCSYRAGSWIDASRGAFWDGIGRSNSQTLPDAAPCGIPPFNVSMRNGEQWFPWQSAFVANRVLPWVVNADTSDNARRIATGAMYLLRYIVEEGTCIDPALLTTPAERTVDGCFASRRATITNQGEVPQNGIMAPKSKRVDRSRTGGVDVVFSGEMRGLVANNQGNNGHLLCAYHLAQAFAANRAITGFEERCSVAQAQWEAQYPELSLAQGYEALSHASDSRTAFVTGPFYTAGASNPPPRAHFTSSAVTGAAPLSPTLNSSSSSRATGTTATAEWMDNWDGQVSSFASDSGVIDWEATKTYSPTYSSAGTYFPGLRITQSDGQVAYYRHPNGIFVGTLPVADPPSGIDITPDDATPDPGQTVELAYSETGVPATSWLWQYRVPADSSTWLDLSTDPTAALEIPASAAGAVYDIRVQATNEFGTTTHTEASLLTVVSGTAPTAGFTLTRYRFQKGDRDFPRVWVGVEDNTSANATAYLWTLMPTGVVFEGERPPAFQLRGKGTFTLYLIASNPYGVDVASARISVLAGNELVAEYGSPTPLKATWGRPDLAGSWGAPADLAGTWDDDPPPLAGAYDDDPPQLRATFSPEITDDPSS